MQNSIKFFSVLLVLLFGVNSYATSSGLSMYGSAVVMSTDFTGYNDNGSVYETDKADITDLNGYELGVVYTYLKDSSSYNEIKYNILLINGKSLHKSTMTSNTFLDTDISYRHTEVYKKLYEVHYGIALGYHRWHRAITTSIVEDFEWFSVRPTLGVGLNATKNIYVGLLVEYQIGFDATMKSSSPELTFMLGGADVLELSLPLKYSYDKNIDFFVEGVYQEQRIVQSNVNNNLREPDSKAYSALVKAGMAFKF